MIIDRDYVGLFQTAVKTLRQNYPGINDGLGLDHPEPHINRLAKANMIGLGFDSTFITNLNAYLGGLKNRHLHLNINTDFTNYKPFSRGFYARRNETGLFVTICTQSQKLQVGDQIIRLGEFSMSRLLQMFGTSLYGEIPERELWSGLMKAYNTCDVRHPDGSEETIELEKFYTPEIYENRAEALEQNTVYLKLEDFSNAERVQDLLIEFHESICDSQKLILDLRRTHGGDEDAVIALIPYLFRQATSPAEVLGAKELKTLYSRFNCDVLKAGLSALLNQIDPEDSDWIDEMIAELDAKADGGLLDDVEEIPEEWNVPLPSMRTDYEVILLIDTYCRGTAETLAARCSETDSATLVGRPSMGELGYCHPITVLLDEAFSLTYPISRTADADIYASKGVPVHDYIPWTTAELKDDILLKKALEL